MPTPYTLGEKKISLASSWNDVSISQFVKLGLLGTFNFEKDLCKILSILSGESEKFWFDTPMREDIVQAITISLEFLREPVDFHSLPLPTHITIEGKSYEVPVNLSELTFGQRLTFESLCMKKEKVDEDNIQVTAKPGYYSAALAVYMMPVFTGENFTDKDLDKFIEKCSLVKLSEGFPVANFFLNKYYGLNQKNPRLLIPTTKPLKMQEQSNLVSTGT